MNTDWKVKNPDPKRRPARDPVIIAAEKAYKASNQFALDKLLRQERIFKTRLTKALSGLERTQSAIRKLLVDVSKDRMGDQAKGGGK